ncbi:MAG: tRNA (adenosine(37)-N6)-dimethylallyltransferase MiaA [Acidithiobacillus sp.]|nr:tRNA (adenosine(37)-N6)-dimethylallyltransferase MiaA [Acidithiobacillus sp.]
MIPVLFLYGATASGKTDLAVAIAERLPVRLISVDSLAVYRHFNIGSAKPDAAVQERYPHTLIDIREPEQVYSAGAFCKDALELIEQARGAGQIPLLVGGTGLYFRSLERGIAPLPAADPELRARIVAEAQVLGWPALHGRLAAMDPLRAHAIAPQDGQRIQRALELCLLGQGAAEHWGEGLLGPIWKLWLRPERPALHRRIEERLQAMFAAGLVEEAQALFPSYGEQDLPACRAVGYRQLFAWLRGKQSLAQARERILYATRQLAKRQETWFASESADWILDPGQSLARWEVLRDLELRFQKLTN